VCVYGWKARERGALSVGVLGPVGRVAVIGSGPAAPSCLAVL